MRWRNVPGSVKIGCYLDDDGVPWASMSGPDVRLPDAMAAYLPPAAEQEPGTLEIEFLSSGYDDSGCRDYPPEFNDDRDVVRVTCGGKVLPVELRDELANLFTEQIDAVELEPVEF